MLRETKVLYVTTCIYCNCYSNTIAGYSNGNLSTASNQSINYGGQCADGLKMVVLIGEKENPTPPGVFTCSFYMPLLNFSKSMERSLILALFHDYPILSYPESQLSYQG